MPKDKEDQSFEEKVLDGIETVETQQATLVKNYDQLDKDTKKAFEELTKVKETCNSLTENVSAIQKVSLQMKREQRMAFGDPLQRILNNEEQCCRINLLLRLIAAGMGDAGIPVKDLQERFKGITGKALGEDSSPGSTLIDDALAERNLRHAGKATANGTRWELPDGDQANQVLPMKTARPVANFHPDRSRDHCRRHEQGRDIRDPRSGSDRSTAERRPAIAPGLGVRRDGRCDERLRRSLQFPARCTRHLCLTERPTQPTAE
jgi:hypothetical protein